MPLHRLLIKAGLYKPLRKLTKPLHAIHEYTSYLQWVDLQKGGFINDYYTKNTQYKNRFKLHEAIQRNLNLRETSINYLEFGVAQGDMIRFWASNNLNDNSRFIGFDSFTGLPEDWEGKQKGFFATEGKLPEIDDDRVEFVQGWFQDTVYSTLKTKNLESQSIFHLDADLFSSTLYALFQIHPFLKNGDILIFDEFSSYKDEFRAFEIFKKCSGRAWEYKLLGGVNNYRQVAIQIR